MPAGAAHILAVSTRRRPGSPGMPAHVSQDNEYSMLVNKDPQAAEVWDLVIDTATNSEDYGLNLTDPVSASIVYSADSSTGKDEIAAGLVAAWNESPLCRMVAEATDDGVDTVTLTGVVAGAAFTVAEDENAAKMTLTNTTNAAEADAVPFGRAMISTAYESDEAEELGVIAKSTALTAQVDTLTVDYAASEEYTVIIEVGGDRYLIGPIVADTDDATTSALIHNAINAMMPANTVISTNPAATSVVLTAEVAGKPFKTTVGLLTGTTARLSVAHTTATPQTDFNRVFAGVSCVAYDQQQAAIDSEAAEYPANAGVTVMKKGQIWVESSEAVTQHSDVYVELDGTSANVGKFFTSGSATRVLVDPAKAHWKRAAHSASGAWSASDADVAVLALNVAP